MQQCNLVVELSVQYKCQTRNAPKAVPDTGCFARILSLLGNFLLGSLGRRESLQSRYATPRDMQLPPASIGSS